MLAGQAGCTRSRTIGWDSRSGSKTSPTIVHLPTAAQACDQWAKWHMGTRVDHIAPRSGTTAPSYDCSYPHFLVVGGIHAYAFTTLKCASGYVATYEGCVPEVVPPSPPPCCKEAPRATGSPSAGNPVTLATGAKVQRFVDYESGGPVPLVFGRTYTSRGLRPRTSLGLGWTSSFDREIRLNASNPTMILVYREDGSHLRFNGSGSSWTASAPDVAAELTGSTPPPGASRPRTAGSTPSRSSGSSAGWSARAADGYTQRLEYDHDGRLSLVVDSFERVLELAWDGAVLSEVSAPGDVAVRYEYDREVINGTETPGSERLIGMEISRPDGTGTISESYLYEGCIPLGGS